MNYENSFIENKGLGVYRPIGEAQSQAEPAEAAGESPKAEAPRQEPVEVAGKLPKRETPPQNESVEVVGESPQVEAPSQEQVEVAGEPSKDEAPPQVEPGKFSTAEKPPYEVNLPEGFEIGPEGTFRIDSTEDQVEIRKITPTPFYVAARSDSGKILILRLVNGYWLQDWIKVSKVSKNTLADLNVIPEVGIEGAQLVKYVMQGINKAPFKTSDTSLTEEVKEIKDRLLKSVTYPVEIPVPEIKEICQELEVKYDDVRKWLSRRGFIEGNSKVKRTKEGLVRHIKFSKEVEIRE